MESKVVSIEGRKTLLSESLLRLAARLEMPARVFCGTGPCGSVVVVHGREYHFLHDY